RSAAVVGAGSTAITKAPARADSSIAPSTEPVARASWRVLPSGTSNATWFAFMGFSLLSSKGGAIRARRSAPVSPLVRIDRRFREQVGLAVRLVALRVHVAIGPRELVLEPRGFPHVPARHGVAAIAIAGDERGRDHVVL